MKKTKIIIVVCCVCINILFSNMSLTQTISGYVIDKQSRQAVEGAVVTLAGGSETLFFEVKRDGFYSFEAYQGTYTLACSRAGYENFVLQQLRLGSGENKTLDLELQRGSTPGRQETTPAVRQENTERLQSAPAPKAAIPKNGSAKDNFGNAYQTLLQRGGQLRYGLRAGFNFADIMKDYKRSVEGKTKIRLSYQAGIAVDYVLNDIISLESGLVFSSKGYSNDLEAWAEEDETVSGYSRVILNYLELPVSVSYLLGNVKVAAGPYIAVIVSGKSKWDETWEYQGVKEKDKDESKFKPVFGEVKENFNWDKYDAIRGFDFGVNVNVGYHLHGVLISAGYSHGLGNHSPRIEGDEYDPKDYREMNRVLNLTATYYF